MKGLTEGGVKSIEKLIKLKFDDLAMKFLGIIPSAQTEKSLVFKTTRNNIISLFLQALGDRSPDRLEERTLKTMVRVANGYMNALRDRTANRIVHDIDAYVRTQSLRKEPVKSSKIQEMMEKEMRKARNHIRMIASAESNKAINTGTALNRQKIGEKHDEGDPTVFFVVTHDDVTGPEEYVLHTLKDRKTPRVWKMSEIGAEYHKKGDPNPKLSGLHPNCRCKLAYLPKGFGFNEAGGITYIGKDHDEFEAQRKEHGLPR